MHCNALHAQCGEQAGWIGAGGARATQWGKMRRRWAQNRLSRTAEAARREPDALLHEGDRDGREAAVGAGLLSQVAGGCLDRGVPPLRGAFPVGGALVGVTPALAHGSTPRTLSICELTDPETHGRSQNVLCLTRK